MGRPKEEDAIKLSLNIQESQINIRIEHVKDFITWEKIKKFSREEAISFSQLIKSGCSNTANHWIDYWIQSGMINKIFMKKGKVGREDNGKDHLMKMPGYALILLGIIISDVMDNKDFADYHSKLLSGNTKIEKLTQLQAKQRFEQQKSNESLIYFWILLGKAMDAWEDAKEEINFSKNDLCRFNDLLFKRREEYYGYCASDYGIWGVPEEDETDEESEVLNSSMIDEEEIPESSCEEENVTFERFTEVYADLYGRLEELCINSKDEKSNETTAFWGTRSVRFAPFLGAFIIGLKRCYNQFPFNPKSSVLDLAMEDCKKMNAPKAYVEIVAYLMHIGDERKNEEIKKPLLFWEEYVDFCIKFYSIIIGKQAYKPKNRTSESKRYIYQCLKEENRNWGTYGDYKECIIYIFEKLFAYGLFLLESKVIFIELVRYAIKKKEKEREGAKEKVVLEIFEEAEIIMYHMQVGYVDTISMLLKDIYENSGVHVRMKLAPKAIKEWMGKNIIWNENENVYDISNKSIESGIINYDFIFLENIKEGRREISKMESMVDKTYIELENILSQKKGKGCKGKKSDARARIWDNIIQEIRGGINEKYDELVNEMIENHMDRIKSLYDKIFFWVVKVSLDLEKVKIE